MTDAKTSRGGGDSRKASASLVGGNPPREDTSPEETGASLPVSADEAKCGVDPASGEETFPLQVLHPSTGEILVLKENLELGQWLVDAREWKSNIQDALKMVEAELLRRMDRNASWTVHAKGMDITGSAPGRTTFNAEELDSALEVLEQEGKITHAARRAAVEEVTSLKAKRQGINQLMKLGGEVEELVRSLEKEDPRPRRINVKVKP